MASPVALPTKLKNLRGTVRKCREAAPVLPVQRVTKVPPAPKFFSKVMKQVYNEQVKRMMFLEILEPSNINLAVAYAWSYGKWHEIASSGTTDVKRIKEAQNHIEMSLKIGALIGADPVNTHRLKINNEKKTIDGLEEFFT